MNQDIKKQESHLYLASKKEFHELGTCFSNDELFEGKNILKIICKVKKKLYLCTHI